MRTRNDPETLSDKSISPKDNKKLPSETLKKRILDLIAETEISAMATTATECCSFPSVNSSWISNPSFLWKKVFKEKIRKLPSEETYLQELHYIENGKPLSERQTKQLHNQEEEEEEEEGNQEGKKRRLERNWISQEDERTLHHHPVMWTPTPNFATSVCRIEDKALSLSLSLSPSRKLQPSLLSTSFPLLINESILIDLSISSPSF